MTGAPTKHSNVLRHFMRPKLEHLEGGSSVDGHAACFMLVSLLQWLRVWFWPISFSSRIMFRRLLKQKIWKPPTDPAEACQLVFMFFPHSLSAEGLWFVCFPFHARCLKLIFYLISWKPMALKLLIRSLQPWELLGISWNLLDIYWNVYTYIAVVDYFRL